MKKKVVVGIIAVAVVAVGALLIFSQRHGGRMERGEHDRDRVAGMLRGLDLSDEQKAKVKEIFEASKQRTEPIREAMKANGEKLEQATANGAFDEAAVTALANEGAGLSAQATVERLRTKSQIFALLTDEQKAKAAEMGSKFEGRFGGRGKRGGHQPDRDSVEE
jgi:Spy/CpxP family protein refolding chaperone